MKIVWLAVSFLVTFSGASVILIPSEHSILTNQIEGKWDNLFMDIVLDELKFYLKENRETVIPLSPISAPFEYKMIGIPFRGYFNATGGTFTNPASIKREGDVNLNKSFDRVRASMAVTFTQLEIDIPHYDASVIGITESGSMNVTIQNNAALIEVTAMFIPHCIVSITELRLTKMSGIMVNMNGLGILNSLEGEIIAWVLQTYRTSFTEVILKVVASTLQEELAKTKICKLKKPQ